MPNPDGCGAGIGAGEYFGAAGQGAVCGTGTGACAEVGDRSANAASSGDT